MLLSKNQIRINDKEIPMSDRVFLAKNFKSAFPYVPGGKLFGDHRNEAMSEVYRKLVYEMPYNRTTGRSQSYIVFDTPQNTSGTIMGVEELDRAVAPPVNGGVLGHFNAMTFGSIKSRLCPEHLLTLNENRAIDAAKKEGLVYHDPHAVLPQSVAAMHSTDRSKLAKDADMRMNRKFTSFVGPELREKLFYISHLGIGNPDAFVAPSHVADIHGLFQSSRDSYFYKASAEKNVMEKLEGVITEIEQDGI